MQTFLHSISLHTPVAMGLSPTSYLQSKYPSEDIIALASMQETDTHPPDYDDPLAKAAPRFVKVLIRNH